MLAEKDYPCYLFICLISKNPKQYTTDKHKWHYCTTSHPFLAAVAIAVHRNLVCTAAWNYPPSAKHVSLNQVYKQGWPSPPWTGHGSGWSCYLPKTMSFSKWESTICLHSEYYSYLWNSTIARRKIGILCSLRILPLKLKYLRPCKNELHFTTSFMGRIRGDYVSNGCIKVLPVRKHPFKESKMATN